MKRAWKAVLAGLFVAAIAMPAGAVSLSENFDDFATGPLVAVNGWTYDGGASYDVGIVSPGIDGKSLQISNAATDGAFDNWPMSQRLVGADVASETGNQEFVATFDVQGDEYRAGLQASVAPQSDTGARMSYVSFTDKPGGIQVAFADARDANFRTVPIGGLLTYGQSHRVTIVLNMYEGPHNDVAQVFIDDPDRLNPLVPGSGAGEFTGFFAPVDNPDTANKVKAGQSVPMKWKLDLAPPTTWEDYYRFDPESNEFETEPWGTRPVDSLIFQARQQQKLAGSPCLVDPDRGTDPEFEARDCWAANAGHGLLFDNVTVSSDSTFTPLATTGGPVDASVYGTPIFKSVTGPCDDVEAFDAIETAAAPGASHLTYDAATGIWHYNWQTTKSMAGAGCVKLTLLATDDYAVFKITK